MPRVHAFTDGALLRTPEFGIKASAIAAGGSAVALHARAPGEAGAFLAAGALRILTLARPPEAAVFVNGRPDIAAALGVQGVQLSHNDLTPADARRVFPRGWIGRSVHSRDEAVAAVADGADFLVVGSIYHTASHPGQSPVGPELISECSRLGRPVIAIGGITPERAIEVKAAGAYGVAAIRALWEATDPAAATLALLAPWVNET